MRTTQLAAVLFATGLALAAQAQSTFTYQGRLNENGSGPTGLYDFEFRLHSAASGGIQIGSVLAREDIGVTNGLFSVALDFGPSAFPGADRFLTVAVRPGASVAAHSVLSPRQAVTATPYAITAANFGGTVGAAQLSGSYSGAVGFDNPGNNFIGSGAGLTGLNAASLISGTVPADRLPGNLALLNTDQPFSGRPAFDGGISGASAPFTVDSTTVVPNLNADLLDGQSGGFYQDAGNLNAGTLSLARLADGSVAGSKLTANTVGSDQLADTIALGNSTDANGSLTIYRTGTSSPGITLDGASGTLVTFGSDGLEQSRLWNGSWGELWLNDDTDNNTTVLLTATANQGGQLFLRNPTGADRLFLYGDLSGTARIGIGRSPAANALEVEGNTSKTVAGSWIANSDRRIKEGIRPLSNALDTINRVRPVGFRYTEQYRKDHPAIRDTEYFNVVAQEFAEVFPDSVQQGGDKLASGDQVLQVDTYPATIYSIAAIQELDRELKARDARIAALEQTVAELAATVKGLQSSSPTSR